MCGGNIFQFLFPWKWKNISIDRYMFVCIRLYIRCQLAWCYTMGCKLVIPCTWALALLFASYLLLTYSPLTYSLPTCKKKLYLVILSYHDTVWFVLITYYFIVLIVHNHYNFKLGGNISRFLTSLGWLSLLYRIKNFSATNKCILWTWNNLTQYRSQLFCLDIQYNFVHTTH